MSTHHDASRLGRRLSAAIPLAAIAIGAGLATGAPAAISDAIFKKGADQGLTITPTPLDFGNVQVGATAAHDLALGNDNSKLDVVVSAPLGKPATTDCDAFTVTPAPALPDTIPAGATRTWAVSFTPPTASSFDCSWVLADDDGNPDTIHLTGAGVRGHVKATPSPLDFGTQPGGTTVDRNVVVSNDGTGPITIDAITRTAGPPAFSITALPALPRTLAPSASLQFTARFQPAGPPMSYSGSVTIADDDAATADAVIALAGSGAAASTGATITMTPNPLDFGTVLVGATGNGAAAIGNSGTDPLDVNGLAITGANLADFHFADPALGCTAGQTCAAPFTVAPGAAPHMVTLACTPSAGGLRFANLIASSNASGGTSSVTLRCNGAVPAITVSPGSLSFGTVRVNTTDHAKITIGNSGAADLMVSGLTLDGANPTDFAPQACVTGCKIAPAKSVAVDVTFKPPVRGVRAANLHVLSNDPDQPDTVVSLDGIGGLPVMVITQPAGKSIDFGNIPVATTSSTAPVTVQNQGELTLNLSSAKAAPAAFIASGPSPPPSLPPTGSATWNIACKPGAAAAIDGTFTVTGDDPAHGSDAVALHCVGINSKLVASPSPLSYGEVRTDRTVKRTITVTNQGALAITINSVGMTPSTPALTDVVQGPLPRTLGQNEALSIDVTFAPAADQHYAATLALTDSGGAVAASVAINGDGRTPSYTVAPAMLDLGARCVGQSDAAAVVIHNDGSAHIQLSSVAITGGDGAFAINSGGVTAPIDLAPTASRTVSVVGTAPAGARTAQLVVTTDVTATPTTTVGLAITGTQSGVVTNPGSIGFGAHDVAVASSPEAVSVIDCATAPLTVQSAAITGGDAAAFQVTGAVPATIPIGGTATWSVVFTAQHEGAHDAVLELHNDGPTDPIVVALSGQGNSMVATSPDAGVGSSGDEPRSYYGCGCRAGAGTDGAAPIILALVLGLRRRRSRHP